MKFGKKIMASVLAGVLAFCAACDDGSTPGGGNTEVEVTIRSALNTVKVLRDEDISALPAASLSFEAAKGETEGAQLVLRAEGGNVSSYDVQVSDLQPSGGGEAIPASAVTVYALRYMHITSGYTGFPSGDYPDAMIPMEYTKSAGENKLEDGLNQGLWFDLEVPADAAAGTYTGTVTITADGEAQSVPVTLEVFDFSMPERPAVRTTYLIWQDWLIDGELDNSIEKYEDYYDFLLEYNATAYYFPAEPGDVEGFIVCLRKYYDRVASYGIPYISETITLEGASVQSIDYDLLEDYLTAIYEASVEDGVNYFDKAYYYFDKIYDEITEERYPQMRHALDSTNAREETVALAAEGAGHADLAASVRGIRHIVPVVSGWRDIFDEYEEELIVCPLFNNFITTENLETYAGRQEEGYEIASYGAASFWPYSSHLIDDYMLTTRDVFWSKFDYGLDADLIWNVNAFCNYGTVLPTGYGRVNDFYTEPSRDGVSAGDGYLLYPGLPYGSDKPIPSLRLTALRDGIDDYAYLDMLAERYEALAAEYGVSASGIRDVIAQINSRIYAKGVSKLNFSGLQEVRRTIANLIELASGDAGLLLTAFSADEEGVALTFTAKDGVTVTLNGENLTGTATSSGGGRTYSAPSASYPESGYLEIGLSGSAEGSVSLYVGKAPAELFGTETEQDLANVQVYEDFNSSLSLNEDASFARSGNSLQIELGGYVFDREADTTTFRPSATFAVSGLADTESISFWIYNAGPELQISVDAYNDTTGMTYSTDMLTLAANSWRKITIDNFTVISRNASSLAGITRIGISCANLVEDGEAYRQTLYLDSVFRKMK